MFYCKISLKDGGSKVRGIKGWEINITKLKKEKIITSLFTSVVILASKI